MNHGSLFSGIGGFDLAAEWMGWNNIFHCEWNPFGQKVLKHYWPKAISYGDITKTDFTIHRGDIDIITGGFPCQPFSVAGKRQGENDNRFLWFEMLRAIIEIQTVWVIAENVTGIISMENGKTFEKILISLENEGFQIEIFNIPACAVGAWHKRERIWISAHSERNRLQRELRKNILEKESTSKTFSTRDEMGYLFGKHEEFISRPESFRTVNGVSDRSHRIKAIGNAIVPQVAHEIFKAIELAELKINKL